jgi:hypothetical protein
MEHRETVYDTALMHLWKNHGITYRPIVEIVAEMALDRSLRYEDALEDWTTAKALETPYGCWPATRWHSEIGYRLLKVDAKCGGGIGPWMEARAKEVREIANGIYSRP